jgi:hypothetical protein
VIKKPYGGAFIQNLKKICPRQIFFVFRIADFDQLLLYKK